MSHNISKVFRNSKIELVLLNDEHLEGFIVQEFDDFLKFKTNEKTRYIFKTAIKEIVVLEEYPEPKITPVLQKYED